MRVARCPNTALPPVEFDQYSKNCWYTLNKKYARMKGSKQFMLIWEISAELSGGREAIMNEAAPDMRFETRRNALEVLRKICKSVMLCDERQIRHELMKDGMLLEEFAESMLELAKGMTVEERQRYKDERLYEKLVDLRNECDEIDMEGLADVYAIFDGEGEAGEGGGSDNSEGEEAPARDGSFESVSSNSIPPPAPPRRKVFSIGELS